MVYVNRKNWTTRRPTPKLDAKFSGPYPVLARIGRLAYRIRLPPHLRHHDVFHVSMLEPVVCSHIQDRPSRSEGVEIIEGVPYWEVEAILDRRGTGKLREYLVLWRGFPEEAASWEPYNYLNADELVTAFNTAYDRKSSVPTARQ